MPRRLLALVAVLALALGLAGVVEVSAGVAALPPVVMAPGDTLSVSCGSGLSGSWQSTSVNLVCGVISPTTTPTQTPTLAPTLTNTPTRTATFLPTVTRTATTVPAGMQVGFDVANPHQSVALDLAAINGSLYINFAQPLSTVAIPGATDIRVLRYNSTCPTMVMSGCVTTEAMLGAFVAANHGMTYELGNEPGNPGQDGITGFPAWEQTTYSTIKGADSTANVLGPGVLNWDASSVALYNQLSYDAVAWHSYPAFYGLDAAWLASVRATIAAASSYGASVGKAVWMTETSDYPWCGYVQPGTDRQAAIAAFKTSLQQAGVKGAIWYTESALGPPSGCITGYLFNSDNSLTLEAMGWKN